MAAYWNVNTDDGPEHQTHKEVTNIVDTDPPQIWAGVVAKMQTAT